MIPYSPPLLTPPDSYLARHPPAVGAFARASLCAWNTPLLDFCLVCSLTALRSLFKCHLFSEDFLITPFKMQPGWPFFLPCPEFSPHHLPSANVLRVLFIYFCYLSPPHTRMQASWGKEILSLCSLLCSYHLEQCLIPINAKNIFLPKWISAK